MQVTNVWTLRVAQCCNWGEMLVAEEIEKLTKIGRALWLDPARSRAIAIETLSAVGFVNAPPERRLERAAAAMLERARRDGAENAAANAAAAVTALVSPFYRLEPRERFVLSALHGGKRWTYARLARVMRAEIAEIEKLAWSARLRMVDGSAYPAGAPARGPNCPEYDATSPWTQRFLDEEIPPGQPRIFMRNHLMVCDGCRQALSRCRDFYYAVEAAVAKASPELATEPREIQELERMLRGPVGVAGNLQTVPTFGESLAVFVQRPAIRWFLVAFGALVAYRALT